MRTFQLALVCMFVASGCVDVALSPGSDGTDAAVTDARMQMGPPDGMMPPPDGMMPPPDGMMPPPDGMMPPPDGMMPPPDGMMPPPDGAMPPPDGATPLPCTVASDCAASCATATCVCAPSPLGMICASSCAGGAACPAGFMCMNNSVCRPMM